MAPNITVIWCKETRQYGICFSFYMADDNGNGATLHSSAWITPEQLAELKRAIIKCQTERFEREETE